MMNKYNLLNSPIELGLRIIILLETVENADFDVDDILLLDYYVLHINDFDSKLKSIHPAIPNRENEIFVRRKSIQDSLLFLESLNLIKTNYTANGITYARNSMNNNFSDYLESPYASKLKRNIEEIKGENTEILIRNLKVSLFDNPQLWIDKLNIIGDESKNERI
ncbi:hypothetical protein HCA64_01305 [Listeria booriae]|uniref:Threonine transporter n=1 Tax=Listeria booriae TaxID=1552123 RepID=A0A099W8U2_9LIST|nr:ABC-three component system middle component 2 [Listeria booriae]KGL40495.1 hypothetical protein EP57_11440 [Listeria booriae]MBC1905102.1 hypothetical protein [Listeria booriae]STY42291.1 Uncharacterised protein [Listeria booriae]